METRLARTGAGADEREIRDWGMGLGDLWRPIAGFFLWLCVLIPVALFLLFLPLLAGMLSTGQMTVRVPAGVSGVETRGAIPAPVVP
jgi:hypothetical protein